MAQYHSLGMGSSECQARQIYGPIWGGREENGKTVARKEGAGRTVKPFLRADGCQPAAVKGGNANAVGNTAGKYILNDLQEII